MATSLPPRLIKNRHGVFAMRWIVPKRYRNAQGQPHEVRMSLHTKDAHQARILAMQINLAYERARALGMDHDPRHLTSTWTLRAGELEVDVKDEADGLAFSRFLDANPAIKDKILEAVGRGVPTHKVTELLRSKMSGGPMQAPDGWTGASPFPDSPQGNGARIHASVGTPAKLTQAIETYAGSRSTLSQNSRSTSSDKRRTLEMLLEYLDTGGRKTEDMLVHELSRTLLMDFVTAYANRPSKQARVAFKRAKTSAAGAPPVEPEAAVAAPTLRGRTILKAIGHLRDFCTYAVAKEMMPFNPIDESFERAVNGLKKRAADEKKNGLSDPFTDVHLAQIFEPAQYLRAASAADEFWSPLLGLYTGARLGEIVTRRVDDITIEPESGVHVIRIGLREDDPVKNENSRRQVPVAQPLIELGFLKYVDHVRRLGGEMLFPHRIMNKTRQDDPSKHQSRAFGEYLDQIGIVNAKLVFHSFRHTALTWMHVAPVPVPLKDAELIAGHESQETYVRIEAAGAAARRGRQRVQPSVYIHADQARADAPLMTRLKGHVDRTLTFDLDIAALQIAADIVADHVRREVSSRGRLGADGRPFAQFKSGWHTNAERYANEVLQDFKERLAALPQEVRAA